MTDMKKSTQVWNGETGFVDKAMLARHITDLQTPIYFIAGPPAMVAAMKKTLADAGVKDDDIRAEDFSGY